MTHIELIILNIKNAINQKGIKQNVIASRAGFKEKEFSDLLNHRKTLRAEYIIPISLALDVEPNYLFSQSQQTMQEKGE